MILKIERVGPNRMFHDEWTDPNTGETVPGFWFRNLYVEAVGTDGYVHYVTATIGDHDDEEAGCGSR